LYDTATQLHDDTSASTDEGSASYMMKHPIQALLCFMA